MIKIKSNRSKKPFEGFKSNIKYKAHLLKVTLMFIYYGNRNFRKDATTGFTRIRDRFPLIDYNSILIGDGNRIQFLKKENGIKKHLDQNTR